NTHIVVGQYVAKDSRIKYVHRPEHMLKGPSSCRNYGFELSKGEYINWFDDDDTMLPTAIENRIMSFKSDIDVVVSKLKYFDFSNNLSLGVTNIHSSNLIEDYLVGKVIFFISGPIWRKEFLIKKRELFDETLSFLDDWDFNLRMLYSDPNLIVLNESLINYRIHENSLSKKIKNFDLHELKSEYKARIKHYRILTARKNFNINIYKNFILKRYKSILRDALIKKYSSLFLIKGLISFQLISGDKKGVLKSIIGYISFKVFKKGYLFFK
ncbi:MAG: glycosyltransferase, partial [Flavobacteriaceae bacterium]|nr:glycosyltransferase [Flavobacteriaceae bacterium]